MSIIVTLLLPLLTLSHLFAAATPTPVAATLPPIVWQAIGVTDNAGATTEIAEPERYTAQFLPDGSVVIRADCNRARSSYELTESRLVMHPGISTLALCPPDSHDQVFMAALHGATSFAFDDDGLLILSGAAGELTMQATLEGVVWQWEQFQGGDDSVVTPEDPSRYTLEFLPDARLAIGADCNRAMGTWSDDDGLQLTIGGMTRAMCPEGSHANDFVEDLGFVRSHVFRDGKLHLALLADAGIMTFAATVASEPPATPAPAATPQG
ncbi:MAG: META domain-containing protein [Thermomicrobiales bacterium]|nr:META domain-containing protein [Thermomicrobiales bacterium]